MRLVHVKVEHWSPGGAPFSETLSVAARTSLMDASKGGEVVLSLIDKGGEHEIIMPYREGVAFLKNLDAVLTDIEKYDGIERS